MKKLAYIIGLAVAMIAAVNAQTNSNTDVIEQVGKGIWQSGILNATNYSIEPYATYAPQAPSKVGGGLFVAYNVNNYIGTGVACDYLGHFTMIAANCQLKYAMHPIAAAPNFAVIPFVLAGVGTATGGSGSSAIVTTDAGAYVQFGHLLGGSFNLGGAYGRWDNAGAFSGPRYHIFAGWSKGF